MPDTLSSNKHDDLITFLSNRMLRNRSVSEIEGWADFVETKLPEFIRAYFDQSFGDAYEPYSTDLLGIYRQKLNSHSSEASKRNAECGGKYSTALKYYKGFLESKLFKGKIKIRRMANEIISSAHVKGGEVVRNRELQVEDPLCPIEAEDIRSYTEGALQQVSITRHERNAKLRQACLKHYGAVCQICGMDFGKTYGHIGTGFIEVHHIVPISTQEGEHNVDPIIDMIPLCSNCHSMIHRGANGSVLTPDQLRELIESNKSND